MAIYLSVSTMRVAVELVVNPKSPMDLRVKVRLRFPDERIGMAADAEVAAEFPVTRTGMADWLNAAR
jgi:hypothetical protein